MKMKDAPQILHAQSVLITGANTGIGYAVAAELARQGAHLILACRDSDKSRRALAQLKRAFPTARMELVPLDLADPEAIVHCAQECWRLTPKLHGLVNNAAVMAPPLGRTRQGFEEQLAVNHIGHYLLTGHLLDSLRLAGDATVVTVTSQAALEGTIDWEDPHFLRRPYDAVVAYRQSKLANLLFAHALGERFGRLGLRIRSLAADPGYCRTDLQRHVQGWLRRLHVRYTQARFAHGAESGAMPIIAALQDPSPQQGSCYKIGASEPLSLAAFARKESLPALEQDAERLWALTEEWTQCKYNFPSL